MKTIQPLINYWRKTAEHDYETMVSLFKSKRYSDSLFFGHIILEKILKAHVVRITEKEAPYTHNLSLLAGLIEDVQFSERELELLDDVNRFNIRTRYPDFKFRFYKQCTLGYTKKYLARIKGLYQFLCLKLE